ncbi:hypothetical protein ABT010_13150 [Streptomyces sp. NPDC002668]|uniref:hypothetical protein n=1 Tax=Streptomyces sp. NPDC002668 TaxID=3154422 RepID=UPI003323C3E6
MSKVLNATVLLDGGPADVVLAEPRPGYQTLQIDRELTLLLDLASPETLRAIGAAFYEAADEKAEAAIVALNTPPLPVVPASLHPVGPDYGTGRTA